MDIRDMSNEQINRFVKESIKQCNLESAKKVLDKRLLTTKINIWTSISCIVLNSFSIVYGTLIQSDPDKSWWMWVNLCAVVFLVYHLRQQYYRKDALTYIRGMYNELKEESNRIS